MRSCPQPRLLQFPMSTFWDRISFGVVAVWLYKVAIGRAQFSSSIFQTRILFNALGVQTWRFLPQPEGDKTILFHLDLSYLSHFWQGSKRHILDSARSIMNRIDRIFKPLWSAAGHLWRLPSISCIVFQLREPCLMTSYKTSLPLYRILERNY